MPAGGAATGINAPYGGFQPRLPPPYYRYLAKALGALPSLLCMLTRESAVVEVLTFVARGFAGATAFFFMFYRIKQDGAAVFLVSPPLSSLH